MRRTIAAVALTGAAILDAIAPAGAKTATDDSGYDITYQVAGTQGADVARIRYQTGSGEATVNETALPWTYSFHSNSAPDGYNVPAAPVGVYVDSPSGSSVDRSALYTCRIWVNGQLMETRTRDAGHIAICVTHDATQG